MVAATTHFASNKAVWKLEVILGCLSLFTKSGYKPQDILESISNALDILVFISFHCLKLSI